MAYLEATRDGVVLHVRVQPRSSRNEVVGVVGDCLKIRVKAPPVEGAANEACRQFLSKLFGVAKGRVRLLSSAKSRQKRFLLEGLDEGTASATITDALQQSH